MATLNLELDNQTIQRLERIAAKSKQSINDWVRFIAAREDHVTYDDRVAGYQAMAADVEREQEASQWCSSFTKDHTNETW